MNSSSLRLLFLLTVCSVATSSATFGTGMATESTDTSAATSVVTADAPPPMVQTRRALDAGRIGLNVVHGLTNYFAANPPADRSNILPTFDEIYSSVVTQIATMEPDFTAPAFSANDPAPFGRVREEVIKAFTVAAVVRSMQGDHPNNPVESERLPLWGKKMERLGPNTLHQSFRKILGQNVRSADVRDNFRALDTVTLLASVLAELNEEVNNSITSETAPNRDHITSQAALVEGLLARLISEPGSEPVSEPGFWSIQSGPEGEMRSADPAEEEVFLATLNQIARATFSRHKIRRPADVRATLDALYSRIMESDLAQPHLRKHRLNCFLTVIYLGAIHAETNGVSMSSVFGLERPQSRGIDFAGISAALSRYCQEKLRVSQQAADTLLQSVSRTLSAREPISSLYSIGSASYPAFLRYGLVGSYTNFFGSSRLSGNVRGGFGLHLTDPLLDVYRIQGASTSGLLPTNQFTGDLLSNSTQGVRTTPGGVRREGRVNRAAASILTRLIHSLGEGSEQEKLHKARAVLNVFKGHSEVVSNRDVALFFRDTFPVMAFVDKTFVAPTARVTADWSAALSDENPLGRLAENLFGQAERAGLQEGEVDRLATTLERLEAFVSAAAAAREELETERPTFLYSALADASNSYPNLRSDNAVHTESGLTLVEEVADCETRVPVVPLLARVRDLAVALDGLPGATSAQQNHMQRLLQLLMVSPPAEEPISAVVSRLTGLYQEFLLEMLTAVEAQEIARAAGRAQLEQEQRERADREQRERADREQAERERTESARAAQVAASTPSSPTAGRVSPLASPTASRPGSPTPAPIQAASDSAVPAAILGAGANDLTVIASPTSPAAPATLPSTPSTAVAETEGLAQAALAQIAASTTTAAILAEPPAGEGAVRPPSPTLMAPFSETNVDPLASSRPGSPTLASIQTTSDAALPAAILGGANDLTVIASPTSPAAPAPAAALTPSSSAPSSPTGLGVSPDARINLGATGAGSPTTPRRPNPLDPVEFTLDDAHPSSPLGGAGLGSPALSATDESPRDRRRPAPLQILSQSGDPVVAVSTTSGTVNIPLLPLGNTGEQVAPASGSPRSGSSNPTSTVSSPSSSGIHHTPAALDVAQPAAAGSGSVTPLSQPASPRGGTAPIASLSPLSAPGSDAGSTTTAATSLTGPAARAERNRIRRAQRPDVQARREAYERSLTTSTTAARADDLATPLMPVSPLTAGSLGQGGDRTPTSPAPSSPSSQSADAAGTGTAPSTPRAPSSPRPAAPDSSVPPSPTAGAQLHAPSPTAATPTFDTPLTLPPSDTTMAPDALSTLGLTLAPVPAATGTQATPSPAPAAPATASDGSVTPTTQSAASSGNTSPPSSEPIAAAPLPPSSAPNSPSGSPSVSRQSSLDGAGGPLQSVVGTNAGGIASLASSGGAAHNAPTSPIAATGGRGDALASPAVAAPVSETVTPLPPSAQTASDAPLPAAIPDARAAGNTGESVSPSAPAAAAAATPTPAPAPTSLADDSQAGGSTGASGSPSAPADPSPLPADGASAAGNGSGSTSGLALATPSAPAAPTPAAPAVAVRPDYERVLDGVDLAAARRTWNAKREGARRGATATIEGAIRGTPEGDAYAALGREAKGERLMQINYLWDTEGFNRQPLPFREWWTQKKTQAP